MNLYWIMHYTTKLLLGSLLTFACLALEGALVYHFDSCDRTHVLIRSNPDSHWLTEDRLTRQATCELEGDEGHLYSHWILESAGSPGGFLVRYRLTAETRSTLTDSGISRNFPLTWIYTVAIQRRNIYQTKDSTGTMIEQKPSWSGPAKPLVKTPSPGSMYSSLLKHHHLWEKVWYC